MLGIVYTGNKSPRVSELQEVDLVLFYFLPASYFLVQCISLFLFLAPRVEVSDDIGHITRKVLEG